MHPDIDCALADIEAIIKAPWDEIRTIGERAGAYAALRELARYLRERLKEAGALTTYASEKIGNITIHGAGMLGFGERRAAEGGAERGFALGDLSTLRSVIDEILGAR